MQLYLDSNKVLELARRFLEQYHSDVSPQEAILDGEVWTVTLVTGLINKKIMRVRVDGKTGHILGYTCQTVSSRLL